MAWHGMARHRLRRPLDGMLPECRLAQHTGMESHPTWSSTVQPFPYHEPLAAARLLLHDAPDASCGRVVQLGVDKPAAAWRGRSRSESRGDA